MKGFRRIEAAVAISLVFCMLLSFLPFERRCVDIRGKVLRLHILANSDSAEDQALKLRVRDRLLELSAEVFSDCSCVEEAVCAATQQLDVLEAAAQEYVLSQGYDYEVDVELSESFFLTRRYDELTLPAGIYNAVNVYIGNGEGQNWWCVMFPMLCVPGADSSELESVLSEEELQIVQSSGYEIKFRCVEIYEKLLEYFRGKKA